MNLGLDFMNVVQADQTLTSSAAEESRKAEMQPALLAHQLALGREANARASDLETAAKANDKAAAMLAQNTGMAQAMGGQPSMSAQLLGLSNTFAQSGNPKKAAEMMTAASQAAAHESAERTAKLKSDMQGMQNAEKLSHVITSLTADVTDQESWDKANATFQTMLGKPSPFAGTPYDPQMVKMLQDSGTTGAQRVQQQMREKELQVKIADQRSKELHRTVMEGVAADRTRLSQEREARMAKAGGKDVGSPSKGEVDMATMLLNREPGLVGKADAQVAAFDVASQARALRKQNPGLTSDEALRRALDAKKAAGDFTPESATGGVTLPFVGKVGQTVTPPTYRPGGAMALPASGKSSDLKVGQVYKDGSGKTAKWTGKGWTPMGAPGKPAARAPAPPPEDDEDDTELN